MTHARPASLNNRCHLLGEGARWIDGTLWWLDIEAGELWRLTREADAECVLKLPYPIGSFASMGNGGFMLATRNGFETFDLPTGKVTKRLDPQPSRDTRFNDGRVDARGRFWAGTMPLDPDRYAEPLGVLYCLDTDGTVVEKVSGLTISNGIDWSNDNRILYLNDTMRGIVLAFDFDLETGDLSHPREFACIDAGDGLPDGLTVDAHDHVWIAAIGAGKLIRYSPEGEVSCEIPVGTTWPTALTFGGVDLSTVYVTTSRHLMPAGVCEPLAGAVLRLPTEYRGKPEQKGRWVTGPHVLREGRPIRLPPSPR